VNYSIIIPAFNEADELPRTLAAARAAMDTLAQTGELIVVDNNSTDATAQVARQHGADQVVFEPFNQIARARNAGYKVSTGQYLVFIDADTRISPPLLAASLEALRQGKCVGGGSIVHFEGTINAIGRFGIGLWERISKITKIAAGSYLFCLREAFAAEGGFDEKLYASEEVRMSNRLKRWGRARKMKFHILEHAPAQTSARKLNWYTGPQMLGWVFFMMLVPIAVRSRRLCGFWYNRPAAKTNAQTA
jgi:glycosyltransferase involved in cell wall biosynthesis